MFYFRFDARCFFHDFLLRCASSFIMMPLIFSMMLRRHDAASPLHDDILMFFFAFFDAAFLSIIFRFRHIFAFRFFFIFATPFFCFDFRF